MQPMPHGSPGSHAVIVTFAICYRPSVCRLSSVHLSSVTFVQRYTQSVETFGNVSTYVIWYLGHPLTSTESFTEIVPGEPRRRRVKRKRGSQIERFWTYRTLYLENGAR